MSNIYIRSNYNEYPGTVANYDFRSGYQLPLLPAVNLFRSFNYTLYADTANSQFPSTFKGTSNTEYQGYASTGVRAGVAPNSTLTGVQGTNIFKIPTNVEWVKTGGPNGNGVCYNEKGDWLTEESLGTADSQGPGVKLGRIVNTGTKDVILYTSAFGGFLALFTQAHATTVAAWPDLTISGAYNNAVFCYNRFEYTNDDEGTVYVAKSLFELPEKFDNLVSFIPDRRKETTLTFTIKVDWTRYVNWGIWELLGNNDKNSLLSNFSIPASGTEYHTVRHVVNNTNDYTNALDQILNQRQRPLEAQDSRYGQTFPSTEFNTTTPSPTFTENDVTPTTVSGVTYYSI